MDNRVFQQLFGSSPHDARFYGVTVAVVTNNKDPDNLGRVKVKFPWLSDDEESTWARQAVLMSGAEMGTYFLPEVGDEVLVAFEHGVVEYPYVIGSLWNGQQKPPETNSDGKNDIRVIKSRSGHQIKLNDKQGSETVEIIDKTGKNTIVIDVAQNSITLTADGPMTLTAKQDITIESKTGNVSITGTNVSIKAKSALSAEGATAEVKASGPTTIKGAVVNIN